MRSSPLTATQHERPRPRSRLRRARSAGPADQARGEATADEWLAEPRHHRQANDRELVHRSLFRPRRRHRHWRHDLRPGHRRERRQGRRRNPCRPRAAARTTARHGHGAHWLRWPASLLPHARWREHQKQRIDGARPWSRHSWRRWPVRGTANDSPERSTL